MSLTRFSSASFFACSIVVAAGLLARPAHADPKAECIQANTKAQNLRNADQLVEARAQLLICARGVCPGPVRADCTQWLGQVNDSLPTIVLGAKDPEGNDLVQVQVSMDGKLLSRTIDGRALSIDPGAHKLVFEEKGQPPLSRQIVIHEGEKNREIDVRIGTAPKAAPASAPGSAPARSAQSDPAPGPGGAAPPSPSPMPDQPREQHGSTGSTQRTLGLLAGGVGLVGAGVGTVFALKSQSKWNDAKTACGPGCGPGSEAYALNDQSKQAGTLAAISFVAGGALLVTGVVLWLTAPSKESAPAVGAAIGPGRVSVVGRF